MTEEILVEYEDWFCDLATSISPLYAKPMHACQISVALHAAVGMATCATPDGRLCNTALADGSMSAYPGTDRNGPYALMASSCCWDQSKSQNSQMNMKFHPNAVKGIDGSKKLLALIRPIWTRAVSMFSLILLIPRCSKMRRSIRMPTATCWCVCPGLRSTGSKPASRCRMK